MDQIDTRRIASLRRTWKKTPPLFKVVAAFAGVKPQTEAVNQITTQEEARRHLMMTGGKIPGVTH